MFVILLLIGVCVPSASFPNVFYFVRETMTWDDAQNYCISAYTQMAQIQNMENTTTMMRIPTGGYVDKAWIGLHEFTSEWIWVDGQPATYSSWGLGQPDNANADEFCVGITDGGSWKVFNCSEKKAAFCLAGNVEHSTYDFAEEQMTWLEARSHCEDKNSILATVPDETANLKMQTDKLTQVKEAWIGLSRPELWYWTDTGKEYTFMNWQPGQPDNLNGGENCGAIVVKDGTWTDEQCDAKYPFFCTGIYKSKKTLVKIKIQSRANMEDPTLSASLQQQLHAAFVNQTETDFSLTWKKPPVKQT